mmetsp:Transcript_46639/g.115646  ORF Transcript_46639/g.115646 Transcript_46639/m.115646 type:complete len:213 (-) Transcript_46639:165-803(-)
MRSSCCRRRSTRCRMSCGARAASIPRCRTRRTRGRVACSRRAPSVPSASAPSAGKAGMGWRRVLTWRSVGAPPTKLGARPCGGGMETRSWRRCRVESGCSKIQRSRVERKRCSRAWGMCTRASRACRVATHPINQCVWQACPRCSTKIQKNGGCNHITCRNCNHEWCWLCGARYEQGHFKTGNCEQFSQDFFDEVNLTREEFEGNYVVLNHW